MNTETVGVLSILEGTLLAEACRFWEVFETKYESVGGQSFDHPNLTFQGGQCMNVEALKTALDALSNRIGPFTIEIHGFGHFQTERVVYLKVVSSEELRRIHQIVNGVLRQHCREIFDTYLPEQWIPVMMKNYVRT